MSTASDRPPAVIVSATHSGAGKTTVTSSIIHGLRELGLRVAPFKLGPDFIDSAYLTEAAEAPAVNLDLWMMGEDGVLNSLRHWSSGSDMAVIEAMGALYDGADGGEGGSAAAISKLLGAPVLPVVDVWGMTRTAGAVMLGMRAFDPEVEIAGFVLNRLGSDTHREMIEAGLADELRELVLGAVPHERSLSIPERHLGLLTALENEVDVQERRAARARVAAGLDLARIASIAGVDEACVGRVDEPYGRRLTVPRHVRRRKAGLAIARDAAFCFYYEDNLRLLEEAGFELLPFAPTRDRALPTGADAVYLGGGYPESFAGELAANESLAAELRRRARDGMPIYAECGGLLYLARSLADFDGRRYEMAGVLPVDVAMDPDHLAIAYVRARTRVDSPLGSAGTIVRGQEFHQSRILDSGLESELYELTTSRGEVRSAGFMHGNVLASYVHLHFASCPGLAADLLASALEARGALDARGALEARAECGTPRREPAGRLRA